MPGGFKKAICGDDSQGIFSPHTPWQVASIFAAEVLGSAILLFLGCMGTLSPLGIGGPPSHLHVCLGFGLTIMMVIQIIGHTSKAHLNPAVSLCALLLGDIRIATFFVYVAAEAIGAILGVGLLKAITPETEESKTSCCETCCTVPHPSLSNMQAFMAEFLVTAILVFLVCGVWDQRSRSVEAAPLKFGFGIACIALLEGYFTGTSMNPTRSLGPAIWSGVWTRHWIYWVAPMVGSLFSTLFYMYILNNDCSKPRGREEVRLSVVKGSGDDHHDEYDE